MGQFSKEVLAIDNTHTVPKMALDCRSGLGGLNQIMCSTVIVTLSTQQIDKYNNVYIL